MANFLTGCLLDFRHLKKILRCTLITSLYTKRAGGWSVGWIRWDVLDVYAKLIIIYSPC